VTLCHGALLHRGFFYHPRWAAPQSGEVEALFSK
jgi:hypothetical protein